MYTTESTASQKQDFDCVGLLRIDYAHDQLAFVSLSTPVDCRRWGAFLFDILQLAVVLIAPRHSDEFPIILNLNRNAMIKVEMENADQVRNGSAVVEISEQIEDGTLADTLKPLWKLVSNKQTK